MCGKSVSRPCPMSYNITFHYRVFVPEPSIVVVDWLRLTKMFVVSIRMAHVRTIINMDQTIFTRPVGTYPYVLIAYKV